MKKIISILLSLTLLLMCSVSASASTNWNSGDADSIKNAIDGDNVWEMYTDKGELVSCAEGLRVTVYDATTENKVFNTIDITGDKKVSEVSDISYFSDSDGLISKTTWLSSKYVGSTYNALDANSKNKYHNLVGSKIKYYDYNPRYIAELSSITIISENNTSNLEAIRELIGQKKFLVHLCSLIDGLEYDDFQTGKYKISFEPVGYFTFAGVPWALTATECGILDKYLKNTLSSVASLRA